jgi:hypothetical protein
VHKRRDEEMTVEGKAPASRQFAQPLALLVILLIGFAAGYSVRSAQGGWSAAPLRHQSGNRGCVYELPREQVDVIAGLTCPDPKCEGALLVDCHCDRSHGIKLQVRSMFMQGKPRPAIRRVVEGLAQK